MSKHLPFRPDIEGLRALAVLAVLAFHHQWGSFTGGFIGVDVFFVISGYLITRNILSDVRGGNFSFKEFYIRRARRLFPALFFTVAVTFLVGIYIASPSDLQHMAASAMASIFSVSNIYFWGQSGYFDSAAIQKPLLHTWSLAVEEQFYLVWPVLVVLLARYTSNQRVAVFLLAALGGVSVWATEQAIGTDPAGTFYLTHYRISEFALGAICAWVPHRSHKGLEGEVFSVLGLGMIVYPMFQYSETTPFPGFSALLPCVGAAILIFFNGGGVTRSILTNPVATGIGRISYSLYLAHWPIYVFYRQWKGDALGVQDTVLVSVTSLVCAVAMYRYIEQPFRARGSLHSVTIPTRIFAKLFAILTVGLIVVSVNVWIGDGWAWRYPADMAQFAKESDAERKNRFKPYSERCRTEKNSSCNIPTDGINVFVIGDSHAPDAFNAVTKQYPNYHYVYHGLGGCPPLVRDDFGLLGVKHPNRSACIARNERLLYGGQLVQADLVVINTLFQWYKPEHLSRAIKQIRVKTSAPIIVFGNYMIFDDDLPDLVIKHGVTKMDSYYARRLAENTFAYDEELGLLADNLRFTYISKKQLLCEGDSVMNCPLILDGKLFTYDTHHLSLAAANYLGRELKMAYDDIFSQLDTQKSVAKKNETNH